MGHRILSVVVLICVGVLAMERAAAAQVRVEVDVTMTDQRLAKRIEDDIRANGESDSAEKHLEKRFADALQGNLPMFDFEPYAAGGGHVLRLKVSTLEDARYPAVPLYVVFVDLQKIVPEESKAILLDACRNEKCRVRDYFKHQWVETAVRKIVGQWEPLDRLLKEYTFTGEIKADGGMAVLDRDPEVLGWSSKGSRAVYSTGDSSDPEEEFLLCKKGRKNQVGPFLGDRSHEDAAKAKCRSFDVATSGHGWATFHLVRYWP
jgi:hypothetical protein